MVVAELMNFVAYMFAPATVVTPLGALSVVFSAAFAVLCLRERLNVFAQLGCALSLLGASLIVCFAPRASAVVSVRALAHKCLEPRTPAPAPMPAPPAARPAPPKPFPHYLPLHLFPTCLSSMPHRILRVRQSALLPIASDSVPYRIVIVPVSLSTIRLSRSHLASASATHAIWLVDSGVSNTSHMLAASCCATRFTPNYLLVESEEGNEEENAEEKRTCVPIPPSASPRPLQLLCDA